MKKISMFSGNTQIYNLACTLVDLQGTTANLMGCCLAPGESSEGHNHFEQEIFIFAEGKGIVEQNGETISVTAGDAVLFDRFENHVIVNTSSKEHLRFHSIYWPADGSAGTAHSQKPVLIFSTPPTPNGDLHLGHLSGPYMAADTLTRSLRATGRRVRHITGRDDHQTYVVTCSLKEGRAPRQTANHYDTLIRDTWLKFGIEMDGYIEPFSTVRYSEFIRYGIDLLSERGLIVARTEPAALNRNGHYLHEAFISGLCPHCGKKSDGNACEACGRPNNCIDLRQAKDKLSGEKIHIKPKERLYFRLSAFSDKLAQYIKTSNMPAHVAALSLNMINDGLPDICMSHPGSWGIDHGIKGFEDHKIYVWFEMAFGYLWGAADHADEGEVQEIFATAASAYDGQTDIVHCYGFDNAYYHTLLFPAVYMALGLCPPRTHIVNELLDLDGEKFSTSRRHVIWGRDFVKVLPRDYARFALMLYRPEALREDFIVKKVLNDLNELFPRLLNVWIKRFSERLACHENDLPEPGAWLSDHRQFYGWLMAQADIISLSEEISTFSPRRIAQTIQAIITEANRFSDAQTPLFVDTCGQSANYVRTAMALEALALALLCRACRSIMPDLASRLNIELNLEGHDGRHFLSGRQLSGPLHLDFPTIGEDIADDLLFKKEA